MTVVLYVYVRALAPRRAGGERGVRTEGDVDAREGSERQGTPVYYRGSVP